MYLSDKSIIDAVSQHDIVAPFNPANVNPCSYDVTLGDRFIGFNWNETHGVCFGAGFIPETFMYEMDRTKDRIVIEPGQFLLGTTRETVKLPSHIAAQVVGKSSIGRTGLFIHNAGHIDPGFEGKITLELYNAGSVPLDLTDVDRIAQLIFIHTDNPVEFSYDGKYQKQDDVTAARKKKEQKDA